MRAALPRPPRREREDRPALFGLATNPLLPRFIRLMSKDVVDSLADLSLDVEPSTPDARQQKSTAARPESPKTPPSKRASVGSGGGSGGGKNDSTPKTLPPPYVVDAAPGEHAATLVMLHGFTNSGKTFANTWMPRLKQQLGGAQLKRLRLVWLNAPRRRVSCYGDERPSMAAWHDYYSDHGGVDETPEIEEIIEVSHVEWSRARIHEVLDAEAATLGGDYGRVGIGGESQGCCMALDAALTHPRGAELGGVFASCGHVYSCTPVPAKTDRPFLRVAAFHGAADPIIGASLALRTYAQLIDSGMKQVRLVLDPGRGHCEPCEPEAVTLKRAMADWGFFEMVPLAAQPRHSLGSAASPATPARTGKSAAAAAAAADVVPAVAATDPPATDDVPRTPGAEAAASGGKKPRRRSSGKGGGGKGDGSGDAVDSGAAEAAAADSGGAAAAADSGEAAATDGDLEILAAWYGDGDNVWTETDGTGRDVTAHVKRLVRAGELRLNEKRHGGWYNARFSDTAPGTWKVVAVRFRYGEGGVVREVVSPKKENEKAALVITPAKCMPRPSPLKKEGTSGDGGGGGDGGGSGGSGSGGRYRQRGRRRKESSGETESGAAGAE